MMQRILFIINPISGTSRKGKVVNAIKRRIDHQRFAVEIRYTEYAGHAVEIAREAAEAGFDIVVAVGGDGTINEVARSLVHTQTALAIVPSGSGNGLARHLLIPMDIEKALDIINANVVTDLDYGLINDKPFFCTCGVGFDAFISLKFAEANTRGLKTYVEKTLTDGLTYKPETYRIQIGGESEGEMQEVDAFLIACANASQYGNNAYIAPDASMKDGLMDVIVLEPFSILEAPIVAMQLFQRTLPHNSHVKTFRTNRLLIERTTAGPAHCDGDPYETTARIKVELVPAGLRAIINEKALLTPPTSSVQSNMLLRTLEPFQKQMVNLRNQVNSLFDIF
jgi:lipid kinase, YegS/Rv2252/BmrU family